MADTLSTTYGFTKPEVGASADSWGGKINNDISYLDALLSAIVTTGSANAYVLTTGLSLAAYVSGQTFRIKPNFTNSGAATINVDTLGAKNIYRNGIALVSGEIVSGQTYEVTYDGTQFQITGNLKTLLEKTYTTNATVADGVTRYIGPAIVSASESDAFARVDFTGNCIGIYTQTPGASTGTRTYTVRKNSADQTVTVAATGATAQANDVAHSFAVVPGDVITVKLVTSGGSDVVQHTVTLLFEVTGR